MTRRTIRLLASALAAALAAGVVVLGATVAEADLTFPRSEVKKSLDDAKRDAKDAKNGPQKAVDDAKKHAKDAVDDALDGGLATDAGRDGGPADAGGADSGSADGGTDVAADDARETEEWAKSRADRAGRSRETARRDLAAAGSPPMDDAIRDELKVHAKRVAWLDRIGWFASRTGDKDSLGRVRKLLEEESQRHGAWLAEHGRKP